MTAAGVTDDGATADGATADEGGATAAVLAGLLARVEALERAAAAGSGPPAVTTATAVPEERRAGGDGDELWALHALQARLPDGVGAVLLTGAVPLPGGGRALWQEAHTSEALLDAEADAVAARLSALASPVRLRLLREVLAGRSGSGELAADPQFGTSGQVQHHLRQLVAAGWLRATARGHYAVPVERVVPLLVAWAAAGR